MPCSNAFPELVDLDARRGNASNEGMALNADLRVGLGEIPVEGGDVLSVGVRLLRIDLSVDGLRIRPGPRYGEPVQPNEVRTSSRIVTDEAEHVGTMGKLAGGAKADFSGKPAVATNLAARASVLRERKSGHTKHVETTDESVFLRVRALPGQRWRVQEPDNRALEATFLTDNELCQLEPVPQANRHSAGLEVSFSPKDVVVDAPRGWFAGSQAKTKEKIIKAIIARGLNSGSAHASGRIKISEVEVDDAG